MELANFEGIQIPSKKEQQTAGLEGKLQAILSTGVDFENRIIFMTGEVEEHMSNRIVPAIMTMDSVKGPIRVVINSCGGSVVDGFAIHDTLKACKNKVHMFGLGAVYSIAALIFQAADRRSMFPEAKVMIHNGSLSLPGSDVNVDELNKVSEEMNKISLRYVQILAKKSGSPFKKIQELCDKETFFTAAEACQLGLADDIVKSIPKLTK